MNPEECREDLAKEWTEALQTILASRVPHPVVITWEPCDQLGAGRIEDWTWWTLNVGTVPGAAVYFGGLQISWDALGGMVSRDEEHGAEERTAAFHNVILQAVPTLARRLRTNPTGKFASGPPPADGTPDLWPVTIHVSAEGDPVISLITVFDKAIFSLDSQFAKAAPAVTPPPIARLSGFRFSVHATLGRTRLPLEDVFKMSVGSVIELRQKLTDPVEILVSDRLIALGEVVAYNGSYAVRVLTKEPNLLSKGAA
jgi:flagellar motor switch protein FliN